MPADKISTDQAKADKLFYFVANVIPFRESDGRCLILKRDEREKVHPGRYGVVGGKLEWGDLDIANPTKVNGDVLDFDYAVEELLKREAKEEANIDLGTPLVYLSSTAFIRPDGIPVVLLKFAGPYVGGDVKPEAGAFTDFAWVNADEVTDYPVIDGIAEEVAQTVAAFKQPASV